MIPSKYKYIISFSTGMFLLSIVGSSIEDTLHNVSITDTLDDLHHYLLPLLLSVLAGVFGYIYWKRRNIQKSYINLLKDSEYKYRMLFENMSDVVCILDNEGNITDINSAGKDLFEYSVDELLKMNVSDFIYKDDIKKSANYFEKLDREGSYNMYEGRIITKSGNIKWIQVNSKEFIKDGIKIGSQDIIRDITSTKKVEKILLDNNNELKELNATKDKIFSILAHDLKAPFSSLLGFSTLLANDYNSYDEKQKQRFLAILNAGIDNTFSLIENLLLWSQSQTGRITFNIEKINLFLVVNQMIKLHLIDSENKDITIFNQVEESLKIFADRSMLETVIRNILSNAVKFTSNGGNIIINATNSSEIDLNEGVEIVIKDNGIGMSEDILVNLFEVNSEKVQAGTNDEKGTGLGMIICKEFVEKHKGKIWATSDKGNGTEVHLYFPNSLHPLQ